MPVGFIQIIFTNKISNFVNLDLPVDKRVVTLLWCFDSDECYQSLCLILHCGKSLTSVSGKTIRIDFINALVNHHDQFIHFLETEQEIHVTNDNAYVPKAFLGINVIFTLLSTENSKTIYQSLPQIRSCSYLLMFEILQQTNISNSSWSQDHLLSVPL